SIHHNEEYFPEPFIFKPERWMGKEPGTMDRKSSLEAFSPFSVDSRACPGK
ncbi:hypothetical protein DM02DRAFT_480706, partial [Periconia macrospinosa]